MDEAKRTAVLGLVFLLCLVLAYVENMRAHARGSFFNYLGDVFSNPLFAVLLACILRVSTLVYEQVFVNTLALVILLRKIL